MTAFLPAFSKHIVACACIMIGAFNISGQVAGMQNSHPFKKGDAFRILVFPDTAHFLNGIYHIDDSGKVFMPVVGTIKIDDLTEKSLVTLLDSIYLPYLRYPNLIVQPLIRISLLGGFIKPGMFYVNPTTSVWDAIEHAGGTIREDGFKKIKWERNGTVVKENLLPDIEKGVSLSTLGIRSGDQIWVTHVPLRDGWEVFRTDVLPLFSIAVTLLSTTATMYFAYETYQTRK